MTTHCEYPCGFIQKQAFSNQSSRGDTVPVTLVVVQDGVTFIAHGWNKPYKPRKALVCMCCVATAAPPSCHKRPILKPKTAQMKDQIMEGLQTALIIQDYVT